MLSRLIAFLFLSYATAVAAEDPAPDPSRLTLVFGPYVQHFHYDPDHVNTPWLTGLEWGPHGSPVDFGAAFFRNSFGQDSVYAYVAKRWFYRDDGQGVFLNLTGGILYGYVGQYEDKVPFNHNGFAPAIIPALGYQYRDVNAQLVLLGTNALLFTVGYDFWK